jgi:hypothetical protein
LFCFGPLCCNKPGTWCVAGGKCWIASWTCSVSLQSL